MADLRHLGNVEEFITVLSLEKMTSCHVMWQHPGMWQVAFG